MSSKSIFIDQSFFYLITSTLEHSLSFYMLGSFFKVLHSCFVCCSSLFIFLNYSPVFLILCFYFILHDNLTPQQIVKLALLNVKIEYTHILHK